MRRRSGKLSRGRPPPPPVPAAAAPHADGQDLLVHGNTQISIRMLAPFLLIILEIGSLRRPRRPWPSITSHPRGRAPRPQTTALGTTRPRRRRPLRLRTRLVRPEWPRRSESSSRRGPRGRAGRARARAPATSPGTTALG